MDKTNEIISGLLSMIKNEPDRSAIRFPTEAELCEKYDTSRSTVREALKILQYFGIIKSVRGSGYSVTVDPRGFSETAEKLLNLYHFSYQDISEVLEALEIQVIRLIQERVPQKEDLDFLSQCVNEMTKKGEAAVEADQSFHDKLAEMSGNQLFIAITASISRYIHQYIERFWYNEANERYGRTELLTRAHRDIIGMLEQNEKLTIEDNPITEHYSMSNQFIMSVPSVEKTVASGLTIRDLLKNGWSSEEIAKLAQELEEKEKAGQKEPEYPETLL